MRRCRAAHPWRRRPPPAGARNRGRTAPCRRSLRTAPRPLGRAAPPQPVATRCLQGAREQREREGLAGSSAGEHAQAGQWAGTQTIGPGVSRGAVPRHATQPASRSWLGAPVRRPSVRCETPRRRATWPAAEYCTLMLPSTRLAAAAGGASGVSKLLAGTRRKALSSLDGRPCHPCRPLRPQPLQPAGSPDCAMVALLAGPGSSRMRKLVRFPCWPATSCWPCRKQQQGKRCSFRHCNQAV